MCWLGVLGWGRVAVRGGVPSRQIGVERGWRGMAVQTPRHGSPARYRAGCRCEKCRKWKSDSQAEYRRNRKLREAEGEGSAEVVPTGAVVPTVSRGRRHRPVSDDPLVVLIDEALWDERGKPRAAEVAAERIRSAGYRLVVAGPIESAAREALGEPRDASARMRYELLFRGARSLDDPENARYYASTVEAMRKILADIAGPDGDGGGDDIVEAIRRAARGGDDPEVDDPA